MRLNRSIPLLTMCAALAASLPSYAANTFLLQLGEHESQAAAEAQWETLQTEQSDLLEGLSLRVQEVDLGVETEFRTQASALASRSDAQSRCTALDAAGVNCRVVETSMYQPEGDVVASNSQVDVTEDEAFEEAWAVPEAETATAPVAATRPATENKGLMSALLPWLQDDAEEEVTIEQTASDDWVEAQEADAATAESAMAVSVAELPAEEPTTYQPQQMAQAAPNQTRRPVPQRIVPERAPEPLNQQIERDAPAEQPQAQPALTPQNQPVTETANGSGQVEVAEAIRVPLSFGEAAPVPVNKPVGYGGFPSEPLPKGTLWVQLNYFTGKDAAMSYLRNLSYQHPDLTRLLRSRVISPFQSRRLYDRTSLRLGPFSSRDAVNRLCGIAQQQELECVMVNEVGTSAAAQHTRYQGADVYRAGRRIASARTYGRGSGSGMYWVHLGGYTMATDAQSQWNRLQSIHQDLLGRLKSQVSYPTRTSSSGQVFHLRTGPFAAKASADQVCDQLQARQQRCVVVKDR